MATEVQGSHIGFYFRDYGSTVPYKKLVCEESVTFDLNNDVTTTKTKCGVFKGVDIADFKANGSAVHNINPSSGSEGSYDDVFDLQISRTKQEFVIQNEAYDAVLEGASVKLSGAGFFVGSQLTGAANDVVKFTWNFEGVGTPDNTES